MIPNKNVFVFFFLFSRLLVYNRSVMNGIRIEPEFHHTCDLIRGIHRHFTFRIINITNR